MTIDWTKAIEAVHVDGRVVALEVDSIDEYGDYKTNKSPAGDANEWWFEDGRSCCSDSWRIRNVASEANEVSDELTQLRAFRDDAIKRFPELAPVDPDLLEAREICAKNVNSHNPAMIEPYRDGEYDNHWLMRCVVEGIKRGRELERYAQGLTTPND